MKNSLVSEGNSMEIVRKTKEQKHKMYKVEVPVEIRQICAVFFELGLWSAYDTTTLRDYGRKFFYFTYLAAITIAFAAGAYVTDDEDEAIFLAVAAISSIVLIYKAWFILWRKNEILDMIHQNGILYTDDEIEFKRVNIRLDWLMKLFRYVMGMLCCAYASTIVQLIVSGERFAFNIAFPLDRTKNKTNLCIAAAFLCGGMFLLIICCLMTLLLWYLMMNFVNGYKLLECQFRNVGKTQLKLSLAEQRKLYLKDLITAIEAYNEINRKIEKFTTISSKLFFLQMATSSICICGSVYTLAFSLHDSFIQDAVNCVVIGYNVFDIFVLMKWGNEIKLSSDILSYSLYESYWMDQTQLCKRCIIIVIERMKQPQEILVGKLYPLNLATFGSIVNRAYSIFNILQNLRR